MNESNERLSAQRRDASCRARLRVHALTPPAWQELSARLRPSPRPLAATGPPAAAGRQPLIGCPEAFS